MTQSNDTFDLVGKIMAFEEGELNETEVDELFQNLVDSGLAWSLQGSYGKMAKSLIRLGRVKR